MPASGKGERRIVHVTACVGMSRATSVRTSGAPELLQMIAPGAHCMFAARAGLTADHRCSVASRSKGCEWIKFKNAEVATEVLREMSGKRHEGLPIYLAFALVDSRQRNHNENGLFIE